jgi:hypothetical protein
VYELVIGVRTTTTSWYVVRINYTPLYSSIILLYLQWLWSTSAHTLQLNSPIVFCKHIPQQHEFTVGSSKPMRQEYYRIWCFILASYHQPNISNLCHLSHWKLHWFNNSTTSLTRILMYWCKPTGTWTWLDRYDRIQPLVSPAFEHHCRSVQEWQFPSSTVHHAAKHKT